MSTTTALTAEEFLALPQDDGVERMLLAGELWEAPMPQRNRFHSLTMTCIAAHLYLWLQRQPEPRGQVLTGDAGVRLSDDPDTIFGADVLFVSAEVLARQGKESTIIHGIPSLAVEITSPGEIRERADHKIDAYLDAGVPLVWVLDPHRRTVTVYQQGNEPELVNATQTLEGGSVLPGFSVRVADLFA